MEVNIRSFSRREKVVILVSFRSFSKEKTNKNVYFEMPYNNIKCFFRYKVFVKSTENTIPSLNSKSISYIVLAVLERKL